MKSNSKPTTFLDVVGVFACLGLVLGFSGEGVSPCSLGCSETCSLDQAGFGTARYACLHLQSARIEGMHDHPPVFVCLFFRLKDLLIYFISCI